MLSRGFKGSIRALNAATADWFDWADGNRPGGKTGPDGCCWPRLNVGDGDGDVAAAAAAANGEKYDSKAGGMPPFRAAAAAAAVKES